MSYRTWLGLGAAGLLAASACAPVGPEDTAEEPPSLVSPEALASSPVSPAETAKPPAALEAPAGVRSRIEAAVDNVRRRDLLTSNAFWTIFHGLLGLGPDVTLLDPETRERRNALELICDGRPLRGLRFIPTTAGLDVQMGPHSVGQGHQDQFIAEMGQWGMAPDRRFRVGDRDYTFLDFVRESQARARVDGTQELSWAVGVIAQYRGSDASWTNAHGEKVRVEDLLRAEMEADVENAACGGTHRLFGVTWAYHYHRMTGGKDEGAWARVPEHTRKWRDRAKAVQNADGSFSTEYFKGRAQLADANRQLNTTGHILEWLALALSDEELKADWVERAANATALLILDQQGAAIDSGSLYHAVHGLYIYHVRRWGKGFAPPSLVVPPPPA